MDSPCIDVCVFDGPTGWCLGCGRTRPECVTWKKTVPYRRRAVLADLPRCLGKLTQRGPTVAENSKTQL